jgi:hypothetical protein
MRRPAGSFIACAALFLADTQEVLSTSAPNSIAIFMLFFADTQEALSAIKLYSGQKIKAAPLSVPLSSCSQDRCCPR